MSNRPSAPQTSTDRPTGTYPTAPFAGWRDRTPTEELPPVAPSRPEQETPSQHGAGQDAPSSEQPRRQARRRHLRAALTGIALAALILTGLQLYALDGINDAREAARAARAARPAASTSQPAPSTGSMSGQTPMPERAPENARTGTQPEWVTQDTGAPYDRTDASASPLSLPRCTTSPTTPTPCLAHVSADSNHAVVLEEDASLTGLVRQ